MKLLVILWLLLLSATVFAQSGGTIVGHASQHGVAEQRAVIELYRRGESTPFQTAVADEKGDFRLVDVPAGNYRIVDSKSVVRTSGRPDNIHSGAPPIFVIETLIFIPVVIDDPDLDAVVGDAAGARFR